jgi:hypothetical protein
VLATEELLSDFAGVSFFLLRVIIRFVFRSCPTERAGVDSMSVRWTIGDTVG